MKALIFNSGIGKRMGELTKNSPKAMVKLLNGETVFERQIRLLSECGIKEFVVTTGPFEEQLTKIANKREYGNLKFTFVHNDLYDKTNYIYSCYLAREYLDDDLLTLHGDLVFNKNLVTFLLQHPYESVGLVNAKMKLPEKDFKARVIDGKIVEVGVNIFDENCYAFQPLYKLSKKDAAVWLSAIVDFIENKNICNVYAENAFNTISSSANVRAVSYERFYINEIDDPQDYEKVTKEIRQIDYKEQEIVGSVNCIRAILERYGIFRPLIVVDSFLKDDAGIKNLFKTAQPTYFSDFKPNPDYNEVLSALELFRARSCDGIVAIGGGSAIDVAKAVKLFAPLNEGSDYLHQDYVYSNLKLIAVPTTAGTGSESTRFSVIYYKGEKQSLAQDFLLPDVGVLDVSFLKTLPLNQKKATLFDALCHSVESIWSIHATADSIGYASEAIKLILGNISGYFDQDETVFPHIVKAANLAGKAINISQTTAAHAMSYKLTSLYHVPHGQAVAVCLPGVWRYLREHSKNEISDYTPDLSTRLQILDELFCGDSLSVYESLIGKYGLAIHRNIDAKLLSESVNPTRLGNFPVPIDRETFEFIFANL